MLAVILAALVSSAVPAQQPGMSDEMAAQMKAWEAAGAVGEHHENLRQFEGKWEVMGNLFMAPGADPLPSRGWSMNKMTLNGRYLHQDYAAEMGGKKYRATGYLGYDNTSGKHVNVWMDDASTLVMLFVGTSSDDGKRIEMAADHLDPISGKPTRSRGVLERKTSTLYSYEGYTQLEDGTEFKNLEIIYRKREEE